MESYGVRRLRRFAYGLPLALVALGFAALLGWAGAPSATDEQEFLVMCASMAAALALATAAVALWRRARGRSVLGTLALGGWLVLACGIAALLALAGMPVGDKAEAKLAFLAGAAIAVVLLPVAWIAGLAVRATAGWARDERERGSTR